MSFGCSPPYYRVLHRLLAGLPLEISIKIMWITNAAPVGSSLQLNMHGSTQAVGMASLFKLPSQCPPPLVKLIYREDGNQGSSLFCTTTTCLLYVFLAIEKTKKRERRQSRETSGNSLNDKIWKAWACHWASIPLLKLPFQFLNFSRLMA
jgi:hypothetical protein